MIILFFNSLPRHRILPLVHSSNFLLKSLVHSSNCSFQCLVHSLNCSLLSLVLWADHSSLSFILWTVHSNLYERKWLRKCHLSICLVYDPSGQFVTVVVPELRGMRKVIEAHDTNIYSPIHPFIGQAKVNSGFIFFTTLQLPFPQSFLFFITCWDDRWDWLLGNQKNEADWPAVKERGHLV